MLVEDPSGFPPGASKLTLPFIECVFEVRLLLRRFCKGVLGVINGVPDSDTFSPLQLLANVMAVTSETVVKAVEFVRVSKSMLQKLLLTLSFDTMFTSLMWLDPKIKSKFNTYRKF